MYKIPIEKTSFVCAWILRRCAPQDDEDGYAPQDDEDCCAPQDDEDCYAPQDDEDCCAPQDDEGGFSGGPRDESGHALEMSL
ncbi:hypothetical protein [Fibrobacter sp.]|uniref:hypothetical protein n=1 Tax=Fibrobacter sp. TaxID=35828 RepID=UPI00388D562F